MRKRIEATVKELTGFTYDPQLDMYRCDFGSAEEPCGKTYVYDKVARRHWETKHNFAFPLEHSNANPVGSTKVVVDDLVGGDVLRALIKDLRAGKFDLPEMVSKLNGAAIAMDWLHKELAEADLRSLTKKAEAWDLLVEMLPSIPGVYDMLMEARPKS